MCLNPTNTTPTSRPPLIQSFQFPIIRDLSESGIKGKRERKGLNTYTRVHVASSTSWNQREILFQLSPSQSRSKPNSENPNIIQCRNNSTIQCLIITSDGRYSQPAMTRTRIVRGCKLHRNFIDRRPDSGVRQLSTRKGNCLAR